MHKGDGGKGRPLVLLIPSTTATHSRRLVFKLQTFSQLFVQRKPCLYLHFWWILLLEKLLIFINPLFLIQLWDFCILSHALLSFWLDLLWSFSIVSYCSSYSIYSLRASALSAVFSNIWTSHQSSVQSCCLLDILINNNRYDLLCNNNKPCSSTNK